jgi:hypothetical protein
MIRLANPRLLLSLRTTLAQRFSSSSTNSEEPLWKDPFKHALPKEGSFYFLFFQSILEQTFTDVEEAPVDWKYIDRVLPPNLIPEMPKVEGITPSGWRAPRGLILLTYP